MKKNYFKLVLLFVFAFWLQNSTAQVACSATTTNGSGTTLDLYWVGHLENGGSGNWTDPCSWRVGAVTATERPAQAPRPKDNVFFTNTGFTAATSTVAVDSGAFCTKFIMEDNITNTVTFTGSSSLDVGSATDGGFVLANNINFNLTNKINFKWAGAHNIDLKTNVLTARFVFNKVGATFNFVSPVTLTAFGFDYLSNAPFKCLGGTVNTNNNNMTVPSLHIDGASTTFNAGTSTITLTGIIRHPFSMSRVVLLVDNNATVSLESSVLNIQKTDTSIVDSQIRILSGTVNYNDINLLDFRGVVNFSPSINASGNITMAEDTQLTIGGTVTGGLELNGGCTLNLSDNLSVGTLTQTASVNCGKMNNIIAVAKTLTSQVNVNLHDVLLSGCVADVSGGVTYSATDVIDNGGNTNWTITALAPRTLNWTGAGTDDKWSTAANWDLGCVPNSQDDVFFANMNGKIVDLDVNGNCKNMTWTADSSTGTFNNSNNSTLTVEENVQLNSTMVWNVDSTLYLEGSGTNNTADFAGITTNCSVYIRTGEYTFLSDLTTDKTLSLVTASTLNVTGKTINVGKMFFSGFSLLILNASNSVFNIADDSNSWYDYHGGLTVNFTNGSVVNFLGVNPSIGGHPNYQNATFNLPKATTVAGSLLTVKRNNTSSIIFNGSLTLGGSAYFNGTTTFSNDMKNVTFLNGLNITGNNNFYFPANGKVTVASALTVSNTGCDKTTTLRTPFGFNDTQFDVQGSTTGFDYMIVKGMNATGFTAISTQNSSDLGGNGNWNFYGGGSTPITYYWRADATNATVFNGSWGDANHWTTTQTDLVGGGMCSFPRPIDNVIFDNLSDNGTATTEITALPSMQANNVTMNGANVKFVGTGSIFIAGDLNADNNFVASPSNVIFNFSAINTSAKSITTPTQFDSAIYFLSDNVWTINNDLNIGNKNFNINKGGVVMNNKTLTCNVFSVNTSNQTLNLTGSTVDVYNWDIRNATNVTLQAPIKIMVKSIIYPGNYTYNDVESTGGLFRILASNNAVFNSVKIHGNSLIEGDNTFTTLEYVPTSNTTRTHELEGGKTQTFVSPGGQMIATGLASGFLDIKSTTNTHAIIHKDYGDQMCWDFIILTNLDGTEDADPNTIKPSIFGGLNNTTTNLGGTTFDFTRATFVTPEVNSGPDQSSCRRTLGAIEFGFTGSGPYTINYTDGTNNFTEVGIAHGTVEIHIPVSQTATYTVTSVTSDNCGSTVTGTIADATQTITLPPVAAMAQDNDVSSCYLADENSWIHFVDTNTNRAMTSVFDTQDGTSLGAISTKIKVEANAYVDNNYSSDKYMRRHIDINPAVDGASKVRLYFTQAELDQLSTDLTSGTGAVTLSMLRVRRYTNNMLDFTGVNEVLTPTATGAESVEGMVDAIDFTDEAGVKYVEISTDKFGHFVIFADQQVLGTNVFDLENNAISLYPNPAKNTVNVKTNATTSINAIAVYDILGKQVINVKGQNSFSVQNLSVGTYVVKITTNNTTITKKINVVK